MHASSAGKKGRQPLPTSDHPLHTEVFDKCIMSDSFKLALLTVHVYTSSKNIFATDIV